MNYKNRIERDSPVCRSYYARNRECICRKVIGEYCYRAIERGCRNHAERADLLLLKYPFEDVAEHCIKRTLRIMHIFPAQAHCADCYDAGMLAYLYSVHRCAYMGYAHIEAYTAKMIRIYLICAKVAFYEANQLCRENQLYEVRLESLPYTQI